MRISFKRPKLTTSVSFLMGAFLIVYIPVLWKIKVVDLFVLLCFFCLASRFSRIGNASVFLLITYLFLLLATIFAQFRPDAPTGILETVLSSGIAFAAFFAAERMHPQELKRFLEGYLISVTLITLIAVLQFFGYLTGIFPDYRAAGGYIGILGTMPDPNRYALTLSCAVAIVLARLWTYNNKLFLLGVYLFFILAVAMTGSRAGIAFSVLLTGIVLLYMNYLSAYPRPYLRLTFHRNLRFVLVGFGAVASAYIGIQVLLPSSELGNLVGVVEKFQERGLDYQDDPRYEKLLLGFQLFSERPLFGYGFNGYIHHSESGDPHNSYINILVNGGLLAFFTLLIFLVHVGIKTHRLAFKSAYQKDILWVARSRLTLFYIIAMFFFTNQLHFLVVIYAFLGVLANPSFSHVQAKPEAGRAPKALRESGLARPSAG